ncbi:MAG: ATP-binding cassette domain-containing protein, partial [Actinomycetia bacterium]|nr:ATP-binding cassette domain-containing protein [Actinomycetes bacterium]
MPAIECRDVHRHFREVRALDGVDLAVEGNQIFGLLGPNGSGKTTLLNQLQGLDRPTSGEV